MRDFMALLALATTLPALAQPTPRPGSVAAGPGLPVTAAVKGEAQISEPRPIADADDPVNRMVQAANTPGLMVTVTIDGDRVTLDNATPAMIPRAAVRRLPPGGDQVRAVASAGGRVVAETLVPDQVVNAQEGVGLVRTTRRQISLLLPTGRAVDTLLIEAPATDARATLDVRAAYAPWCRAAQDGEWCPRR